jgi:hypothetical protein
MARNPLAGWLRPVAVMIALISPLLMPATAAADFAHPPLTLSIGGQDADSPQVALDSDGDALVVWRRFDGANWRVQAVARSAVGALGPLQILSPSGESASGGNDGPQVAMDGSGDAIVAWMTDSGVIEARGRSAAETLGPLLTLSSAGADSDSPRVAMDPNGNAIAVWRSRDDTVDCGGAGCFQVQARSRSASRVLGPIETLSAAGQDAANPDVSMAANGDALVVWNRPDGSSSTCCDRIQARARPAGAAFGPLELLSMPGFGSSYPDAALDAAGNAVVVWWRVGQLPDLVQDRARSAAGTLAPIERLRDVSATPDVFPRVAVDNDGDALIVWQRFFKSTTWVETRSRSATGTLDDVTTRRGHGARVTVDASGNGVIVWEYLNRVRAMTRSVSGTAGPIQVLTTPVATAPDVAVDPLGHALAVWVHDDGTNLRIQASPGP